MRDILRGVIFVGVFTVPFLPLVVANSLFFPFITGKNFGFRIIVEIIFAAWILLALLDPAYRPRFSWILAAFSAFIGIILLADIFGENPMKSFWSNYERMEGFVALAHLFLYFVVVGSVMTTEKLWNRFFNVTLFAATIVSVVAFRQIAGETAINQGGLRIDATLGNATYMAIYMLFHTFIALLMLVRSKASWQWLLYGGLAALFAGLLFMTATRGTILGLTGGLLLSALYIAIFSRGQTMVRHIALGGLAVILVLTGIFYSARTSDFVQDNDILRRIASISLNAGEARFTIWGMALEGVKERPILGWGQGNFNYVFNQNFEPSLHGEEAWFDRVHNIVMDWLVAAGVLGLLSYFSILAAALYYLVVRPLMHKDDETFSTAERAVIFGLFAGYVFHNLFVFDNIISYIFYASMLAYIHSRSGVEIQKLVNFKIDQKVVTQIATPVVGVVLAFSIYAINVPGILAAGDIIEGFRFVNTARSGQVTGETRNQLLQDGLSAFEQALMRGSFANQEIREQIVRNTQLLLPIQDLPPELRQAYIDRTEIEIEAQVSERPNDARVQIFAATFYRLVGNSEKALEHVKVARELSPQKQQIMFEEGILLGALGNNEGAKEVFRQAFELDEAFPEARIFYAGSAVTTGDMDLYRELIDDEFMDEFFFRSDFGLRSLYDRQEFGEAARILERRLELDENDIQLRVSLAFAYNESDNSERAIEVLEDTIEAFPGFKTQGEEFIENIRNGTF